MTKATRPLAILLLVINLAIGAIWLVILHPGSSPAVSRAAAPAQHAKTQSAVPMPLLLVPGAVAFIPQAEGAVIKAPNGDTVAQLAHPLSSFAGSVGAVFPRAVPQNVPRRRPSMTPRQDIGYTLLSEVRYEGSAGTVFISTTRPSAAAVALGIGDPAAAHFTLPDGTSAWTINNGVARGLNQVLWFTRGLIISVDSQLPTGQLTTLVADVVVK